MTDEEHRAGINYAIICLNFYSWSQIFYSIFFCIFFFFFFIVGLFDFGNEVWWRLDLVEIGTLIYQSVFEYSSDGLGLSLELDCLKFVASEYFST